eukprot:CAMPEP_0203762204 /NCGR_PEP_ID=MMETSP0098-20131031/15143_1 /ASSEMBLY_ACC=CAM_ASM_000208 /TAXON_ID=96639 /ORGANISM=" , Strain NY0313808BC1" /LENGTH=231 /DNA_ID=CAMNT_0050656531 /DNA_START=27 /DNA_END=722 /DNA_ORIENTATION=+
MSQEFGVKRSTSGRLKSFVKELVYKLHGKREDDDGTRSRSSTESTDWETFVRVSLTLRDIRKDGMLLRSFMHFSRSEFSEENVLFWLNVQHFKNTEFQDQQELLHDAQFIYNQFLRQNASSWVCVRTKTYEDVHNMLLDSPQTVGHDLFNLAELEVQETLEKDCLPRFTEAVVRGTPIKSGNDEYVQTVVRKRLGTKLSSAVEGIHDYPIPGYAQKDHVIMKKHSSRIYPR